MLDEVLEELSYIHFGFENYLEYFQGCVDDGIIPLEDMENNLQVLHYIYSVILDLSGMLHDYKGNIELAETNIECIRKLAWQDKQIISILERSINIYENLRGVLTNSIAVAEYWCAQKWLNGGSSPGIKDSAESILERYYDLMQLLHNLKLSLEKHSYVCSKWVSDLLGGIVE